MTIAPDEELRPEAGDHTYVFAPLAVNVALCCPTHIAAEFTFTTGGLFTVTVVVAILVQELTSVPVTV